MKDHIIIKGVEVYYEKIGFFIKDSIRKLPSSWWLAQMVEQNLIGTEGKGRATRYVMV